MRALVTGGAGFIGSNLVDALAGRGDEVVVLDDLSTGRRENLAGAFERGAELIEADIADPAAVAAAFDAHRRRRSSISPRRSTSAARWPTPSTTSASTSAARSTCSSSPRLHGTERVLFASTGGRDLRRGRRARPPPARGGGVPSRRAVRPVQARGRGVPLPLLAPLRAGHGGAAARQRLRPPPGPPRRGRRGRDLRRAAARRRHPEGLRRRQARPATTSSSATSSRPSSPRPTTTPPGPSTSAPASRPACSSSAPRSGAICEREFEPELAPARDGEVQRISIDSAAARSELGWEPAVDLAGGLRRTIDSIRGQSGRSPRS